MLSRVSFVRWIIENRINAAIEDNDLQALQRWLTVANKGSDMNVWSYQFYTDDPSKVLTLVDVLGQKSAQEHGKYKNQPWYYRLNPFNRISESLFKSQDRVKMAKLIFDKAQSSDKIVSPKISLSWYQRILAWSVKRGKDVHFSKDNPFTEMNLNKVFKSALGLNEKEEGTMIQDDAEANNKNMNLQLSYREKYSPAQMIKQVFKKPKVRKDLKIASKKSASNLPTDWLKPLSMNIVIDEQFQQQHRVEEKQELEKKENLTHNRRQATAWTEDTSTEFFVYGNACERLITYGQEYNQNVLFLVELKNKVGGASYEIRFKKKGNYDPKYFSNSAKKILIELEYTSETRDIINYEMRDTTGKIVSGTLEVNEICKRSGLRTITQRYYGEIQDAEANAILQMIAENGHASRSKFVISKDAFEIFTAAPGDIRAPEGSFSVNEALPLGFYLTEEVSEADESSGQSVPVKITTLKFSSSYRDYQLSTDRLAAARLDPYGARMRAQVVKKSPQQEIKQQEVAKVTETKWSDVSGGIVAWKEEIMDRALAKITKTQSAAPSRPKDNTVRSGKTITPKNLMELNAIITQKNIILTPKQKMFLESLNQDHPSSAEVIYTALYLMADHAKPEHLSAMIDCMMKMNNKSFINKFFVNENVVFRATGKSVVKKNNLLDTFCVFLKNLTDGKTFDTSQTMQALNTLCDLTDEELSWFQQLTACELPTDGRRKGLVDDDAFGAVREYDGVLPPEGYQFDFLGTYKAFNIFIRYFRNNDIPLPMNYWLGAYTHQYEGVSKLSLILACIDGSKNPKIQAKWVHGVIKDMPEVISHLKGGYCVVHGDMGKLNNSRIDARFEYDIKYALCLPEDNLNPDDPLFVKKFNAKYPQWAFIDLSYIHSNVFQHIQYKKMPSSRMQEYDFIFYKAIFLRYLAYNCNVEAVEQGLKMWDELINESIDVSKLGGDELEAATGDRIKQHWQTLKSFALSQPTKLQQSHIENAVGTAAFAVNEMQRKTMQKQQYSLNDLKIFLKELNQRSSSSLEAEAAITSAQSKIIHAQISELNRYAELYSDQQLPEPELLKKISCAKQDLANNTISFVETLALLREYHYRKSGEWLRLEQAVVILSAIDGGKLYQVDTGEGKTLIIQFTALLKALLPKTIDGQKTRSKVDILTHNEVLAKDSYDQLRPFAAAFGLSLSTNNHSAEKIKGADIHVTNINVAVINDKIAQVSKLDNPDQAYPGDRAATDALLDEADNFLDVHANTSMQFSRGTDAGVEADVKLEIFLNSLNDAMDNLISELNQGNLSEDKQRRDFVIERIQATDYYNEFCKQNDDLLNMWISAAYTRAHPDCGPKENVDYVIQAKNETDPDGPQVVRIVHKTTTGRIDLRAQWGGGVHQCVAAYEKRRNLNVQIPALSQLLAEGNIKSYLLKYKGSITGFSGTLGDAAVRQAIKETLHIPHETVIVPRAKRDLPTNEPVRDFPRQPSAEQTQINDKVAAIQELESKIWRQEHWRREYNEMKEEKASKSNLQMMKAQLEALKSEANQLRIKLKRQMTAQMTSNDSELQYSESQDSKASEEKVKSPAKLEAKESGTNSVSDLDPEQATQRVYNRSSLQSSPMIVSGRQEHAGRILDALESAQEQKYSSIVFFNTIEQCNAYQQYLIDNGIDPEMVQVLDDTNPPEPDEGKDAKDTNHESKALPSRYKFHPPESLVKKKASEPGVITLTTIAGSRGTDFKGITVGIPTTPELERVLDQELGRIGRSGQLGIKYKIFCEEDLVMTETKKEAKGESKMPDSTESTPQNSRAQTRVLLDERAWSKEKQEADLAKVRQRDALDQYKDKIQAEYLEARKKAKVQGKINVSELDKQWVGFFSQVDLYWKAKKSPEEIEALKSQNAPLLKKGRE